MKDHNIDELNKMLKGEYMAIDKYDHYIKGMNNNCIKNELQKIQQTHKKQATDISTRVQQLGGNPINTSGIAGFISEIASNIRNENDSKIIIGAAIEGEKMGVDASYNILNNITDENSKGLINEVISENKNVIGTLSNLMNN